MWNMSSNSFKQSAIIFSLSVTVILAFHPLPHDYYPNPPNNRGRPTSKPGHSQAYKELFRIYEAKNLEFGFPDENERQKSLQNGNYIPDRPILIDVDVYYPPFSSIPKIFVTIPRFVGGVPYSLAYLTDIPRPNGTEVQAFPHYGWHASHGQDCDGLTSVYRVHIDECSRMWILDSGEINFVQHCAPQVVVIDLQTEQMIHRYRLPAAMYKKGISRFVTPIVDVTDPPPRGSCKQAFVYLADTVGLGIVVYDVVAGKSWRIENKYTFPDPDFATQTIAGESFELLDGTFGFSVTPRTLNLRRMLYFHSLSHDQQMAIPLDVINNGSRWNDGINSALGEFISLGRRGVQCAVPAITPHGFLLCGYYNPLAIVAWNIQTEYKPHNRVVLVENPDTLQFVSGLKVIRNPHGQYELWMASNRLQKAFTGTTDYNEINFRIQMCGLDELYLGKKCKKTIDV